MHRPKVPSIQVVSSDDPWVDEEGDIHVSQDQALTLAIVKRQQVAADPPTAMVRVWVTLQFAAIVVLFVYFACKRGPAAILNGHEASGHRRRRSLML